MPTIGQPLPHESARGHVRGEALYIDDLPPLRGELVVDFVGSLVAHGRKADGNIAMFTAADVPENLVGPVFHDEELLASEFVHFRGQPVVAVAGESRAA